jgi:hypothetical protein
MQSPMILGKLFLQGLNLIPSNQVIYKLDLKIKSNVYIKSKNYFVKSGQAEGIFEPEEKSRV